jgi:Amt family ammonium transporter
VLGFSFVVTYILGYLLEKTIGFRISRDEEIEGVDVTSHAESAYELDSRSGSGLGGILAGTKSEG